jgi:hypothetical protein
MFMARHERSARHPSARMASGRRALRLSTLERRYDFHLGEAFRAALQGSHDKAAGHSERALLISRELCADAADPASHQPELAAALCAHAGYGGGAWQAIALLTESAGHYAALAEADPAAYEVPRIDVLTRIALASDAAGSTRDAISLLREVVGMYLKAPAADTEERDLGLARARFHLGRCLLKTGMDEDGLAESQAGLELAADVLDRLQVRTEVPGWLVAAPRYLQLAAPDWAAAAVRVMTLHAAAGRWQQAATAARTAALVSGGLSDLGLILLLTSGGQSDRLVVDEALARALHLRLGARPVRPVRALDGLAWLQVLVHLEEMLDLKPVKLGHVGDVLQVRHPRVTRGHAKDLVVRTLLVGHLEHADDPGGHQATREGGLVKQHQGVKRVTVSAQGVLDEPVVGGVPGRGEQHAVKPDPPGAVVNLVLVPLAPRDLDDYLDVHVHSTH